MVPWLRVMAVAGLVVALAACQGAPVIPVTTNGGAQPAQTAQPPAGAEGANGGVAPVATPLSGEEGTPQPVSLAVKVINEASEAPRYTIQARYPYLSGSGSAHLAAFNQTAESLVFAEIGRFKQELNDTANSPDYAVWPSQLTIDFLPTLVTSNTTSVLLKISSFMPGAAHPGNTSYALNYDLRQGRALALNNLFQPGAGYLNALSSYCLEDLRARGVLAWEDGALPREENYRVWNVTPEGLLVTFDEYRVAPYAAGPHVVLVPFDRLREMADPNGALGAFLQ